MNARGHRAIARLFALLGLPLLLLLSAPSTWAAPTANGRIVYSVNTTTPQHRAYTASTNTFSAAAAMQTGVAQRWMVDRAAPTRDEHIAGYVTTTGVLYIQRWNGTAWTAEWNLTVGGNGVDGRRFDIAYENTTGDAMVVYSTNATGAAGNEIAYRKWNGTAWTVAANITSAGFNQNATVTWIKLKSRPTAASNEIALLAADTGTTAVNTSILTSFIWNGTAWTEAGTTHTGSAGATLPNTTGQLMQNECFDQAYETTSGDLLVVFTTASTAQQWYRTYSGGTWGTATSYATGRAAPLQMVAESDPLSDKILVMWNRSGSTSVYARVWSGTAQGTQTTVSNGNGVTTATNKKHITAKWLVVGGVSYAVPMWVTSTAGTIGYAYYTGTTWTSGASGFTYVSGTGTAHSFLDTAVDPGGADTLMLTLSDANSDLFAKRLVLSAGPAFTWTNADGGAALTAVLASITSQNFSFAYDRSSGPVNSTTAGTVSAVSTTGSCTGITVTAPYTNDANANNTLSYRYRTPTGTGTWSAAVPVVHSTSPYTVAITGLTFNATYDVEVTYVDADGVTGTATQTVSNITVGANCTGAGTVTAAQTPGATPSIAVSAPYTGDANGNNALSYRYRTPSGTGIWTGATNLAHSASPYAFTISTLTCGSSYDIEVTYADLDGIGSGTALQTVTNIQMTNCTLAGTVTATAGTCGSISVTAPYTQDADGDNTLSYRYRTPTGTGTWTSATAVPHSASPYSLTIPGLTPGTYDVEVTYVDADGISGTATQTVTNLTVSASCTTAGTVTVAATAGSCTSLTVTAPYTGDSNGSNTLSYRYRTPSGTGLWTAPATRAHSASPYSFAIAGLTANTAYDVEATYVDADGVSGVAVQTVTAVSTGDCRTTVQTPTASVDSCSQITITAPYAGDANGNNTLSYRYRTPSGTGAWTASSNLAHSASPYSFPISGLTASSTYDVEVTFADTDGIVGTNPQVIGPLTTPACAVNNTTPGTASAAPATCTTATVTATFTGDANNNGSFTVETGPSSTGPWTAFTGGQASGPSPRQLVVTGLTASTTYWFRVTFADPDGVNAPNPIVTGAAITTPACGGDTIAPTATMLVPTEGAVISGVETFKVQVYDASGTGLTVQYQLDSTTGAWTAMALNATYPSCGTNCAIYTATLAAAPSAGAHYLAVKAADAAGNATVVTTGFTATPSGSGTGTLLRRTHGSELCIDCHNLETHNSQYTSTTYGSWSVDCLTCHTPHKTRNIHLVRESITTPNSGNKAVDFRNVTGVAANSFATPTASGNGVNICEICHTKTKNSDATPRARNNSATDWTKHYTTNCVSCHSHGKGFAAGESEGNANCSGCHKSIWDRMQATGGSTYKHTLAVDTFTDDTVAWGSPLNGNAAATRSCVNMCHNDHPHTATDDPSPAQHYNLAYSDAASNASRAATTRTVATKAKTDFDNTPANGGMCLSCHKNPVESGTTPAHPALVKANYNTSAHNHASWSWTGFPPSHRASSAVGGGTTFTVTINKPTGTVQGDLMIANIAWSTGTTINANPPVLAGWTLLTNVGGTSTNPYRRGAILWKLAGATEPANYAFTIAGSASAWVTNGIISTFRGVDGTAPIEVTGTHQWNNTASTTNTAPGITTLTDNSLVVFFSQVGVASAAHSAWTTATAGAMTEINDSTNTRAMNVGAAILVDLAAGATGNGTVTITSAVAAGVLVALKPATSAGNATWTFALHDGSNFTRNCTKCHWDSADGTTPAVTGKTAIGAVHGNTNPSLLMGTTNPGGAPAGFVCYRCHGGSSTGSDYSGKAVYQDGIKSIKHPMDADTTHDSSGEYYWAAFGNQLAKTNGGTGTRHANCQDCHDPHEAQQTLKGGTVSASTTTTLTDSTKNGRWTASQWVGSILYVPSLAAGQNTRSITASTAAGVLTVAAWTAAPAAGSAYYIYDNKADGALQGSWGAQLSSNPTIWTAPASTNFTKKSVVAGTDLQATVCFKCHSSYYWGGPPGVPPYGLSPNGTVTTPVETDVAMEFNPNNKSGHPVLASLNNFTGSTGTKPLAAAQMVAPWNVGVGTQTMSCGDCHNTDAAQPAAQGPHGSAAQFMLTGANAANWPNVTLTNFATSWCAKCHATFSNEPHGGNHSSYPCYDCHIVIPHGGKMSRLIGDRDTMPARYAYSNTLTNMQVQSFTKAASYTGYATGNCQAACDTTHGTAASENW